MEKWIIVNAKTGKRASTQVYESREAAEQAKGKLLTESQSKGQQLVIQQYLEG